MARATTKLLAVVLELMIVVAVSKIFPEERNALLQLRDGLQSNANLHSKWTGPPCQANANRWPGIACTDWHVTRLVLQGIQLTGSIPTFFLQNLTLLTKLDLRNNSIYGPLPNLSGLTSLEFVFLSGNRFSGSIPSAYIHLPNLKKLELDLNDLQGSIPPFDQQSLIAFNVSFNRLQGKIPETNTLQRFPESSYRDNPDLCGKPLETPCRIPPPPPPPQTIAPPPAPPPTINKRNKEIWKIALIVAVAALVPLCIILFLCCCYYRKALKNKEETKQKTIVEAEATEKRSPWSRSLREDPERRVELEFFNKDNMTVFDLDDLLRASAEILGKGKLSTTYKATLETGSVVTVKRLKRMDSVAKKEFVQQMQLLGALKHENLVEIVSFYYSKDEKLIIYEYIPHGSLHQLLHENRGIGRVPINWRVRVSIVKDIAKGLAYLHQSLPAHKVPHGNIRSSNVLIRQNFQSKLTDYGFFSLLPSRDSAAKLAVARSPEFCQGKKLSSKADVYCFGILLLEVITGKVPGELSTPENSDDDLTDWVKTVVNNDWSTDILDMEILAEKEGYNEMLKLTDLALQCTDIQPEKRPKMSEASRRIEEIEVEAQRKQPLEKDESP